MGFQNRQLDLSTGLQSRGLDQSQQQALQNFYSTNRGLDLQQGQLGLNALTAANTGFLNQGQGLYNVGTTYQQAPWTTINNAAGAYQPFTGLGASQTTSASSGGGLNGFLGGALAGNSLYSKL